LPHRLVALLLIAVFLLGGSSLGAFAQQREPLNVIIIWHFHQPWYYSASGNDFLLPWVRMHSVGNYYKMGYILSKHPDVKVSFTFSGSLLVQLLDYVNKGLMDKREEVSWKIARGEELSPYEKFSMLQMPGGFFDINWERVVNVVPRYKELRDKAQELMAKYRSLPENEYVEKVAESFTEQDYTDLAALFNLFWIDPLVLHDKFPELYKLREEALKNPSIHFAREQLREILEAHHEIMSWIPGIYGELAKKGQVELVPVPYSHPLSAIVADFGWTSDLLMHAEKSIELFKKVFNYTPRGVWPPEQAVNDYVANAYSKYFDWMVTDRTILAKTGIDVSKPENTLHPWIFVSKTGKKVYVFFRDTELSNLISFTYSKMSSEQAVKDLVARLKQLAEHNVPGGVVVIALDGENPWEWYEEFGDKFLDLLYSELEKLQKEGIIRTVTPSEYIDKYGKYAKELPLGEHPYLDLEGKDISDIPISYTADAYSELPRKSVKSQLAEGSWAGGELAIWIGQRQENAAWMLLAKTREDLLRALGAKTLQEAYARNPAAVEYLLRAEASDWFWWYGGDGGGSFPSNPLFKAYLAKTYQALGLQPPDYLLTGFNPDATPVDTINKDVPKPVTEPPSIDGKFLEQEWRQALVMSVGQEIVKEVRLAVDADNLYLAIVPVKPGALSKNRALVAIYLTNPWRSVSPHHPGYNAFPRYEKKDLGMGLFYEILIDPSSNQVTINAADGKGGWTTLFSLGAGYAAFGDTVEIAVPWNMLSLRAGDIVYVTEATYSGSKLVETASRLGLVYYFQVPRPSASAGGKVVFDAKDPVGDDNGAGTYTYPKNAVFKPGVFDITRFRVIDAGSKLVFEVYVRELGGNPWNGPNGFCLQYVHIYVHTKASAPGNTSTFGLNVVIDKSHAWHFALLLAPGWGNDPVPKGERAALYYANGTVVVQDSGFRVYADPARNAIVAEVSKNLLPDTEHVSEWSYVVALTSYDGYGPDRIRPFGVSAEEWVVGVGKKYAQAIVYNVIPRIMDLLAPTKEMQYEMLNSFKIDPASGKAYPAVIRGFSAKDFQAQPAAKTVTATTTVVKILNQTITLTKTETKTLEKESTVTETITKTEKPVTTTVTRTPASLLGGIGVAALVAGLAIGYLIGRRP
jgi:alpha-amylase/alpha-mannosidase (GH57 family)